MQINESICQIPLQSLLDHTAKRLLLALQPIFSNDVIQNLLLMFKVGFDGTHCNSYKQQWGNKDEDDHHIFFTSVVPFELINIDTKEVLWRNLRPSSVRLCRPLRMQFVRESTEVSKNEETWINNEISCLNPLSTPEYNLKYNLCLTMIDGKVKF